MDDAGSAPGAEDPHGAWQESVRQRMEALKPAAAALIAVRAALRVFPLVLGADADDHDSAQSKHLILQTWRAALFASSLVFRSEELIPIGRADAASTAADAARVVADAIYGAAAVSRVHSVRAATAAARATAHAAHAAARAAAVIGGHIAGAYGAEAAAAAAADAAVREEIDGDLARVEVDGPHGLARSALWSGKPPAFVDLCVNQFERAFASESQWLVFAAWWKAINYDAIAVFADEHFAEVVERLAEHDEAFWAPKTQEGATDTDAALGAVSKVFDEAGVDKNFPVKIVQSRQCEDNPTNEDLLRRRPFARALVKAIKEIQAQKRENSSKGHQRKKHENGFAVHLHAPWGAGKSSVLLMMEEYFQSDSKGKVDPADDWVVVHFNAWEHERRNPPWWPLVKAMYDGVAQKLSGSTPLEAGASACSLRRTFVLWKLIPNWLPLGASILVVGLLVVFGFGGGGSGDGDWAETAGRLLRLATSGGAVYGVILVASQALVFGSGENAKFYSGLLQDPLHRIQKLFKAIVGGAGRPIVVMIDDLDRCSATYVVDLLEGVQTAFRDARVVYVVAADRDWIRSSFRQRYEKFKEDVGTPEQPVGYLFLEKIFQLSTPLPGMSADSRKKLLREVTGVGEAQLEPPTEAEIAKEKERLVAKGGFTFDRSGAEGDEAPTQKSEAARAAEVELATSASDEAEAARRHILQDFEDLLPDVPRVMKRVNNAFGFRLGIARLEGADVDERPLARWTILEQRYPLAAGVLADRPDWAGDIGKPLDEGMERKKRKALEPFEGVAAIVAIIGEGEEDALTKEVIEEIVRGGRV